MHASTCSLCASNQTLEYELAYGRQYYRCTNCDLIFMAADYHLSAEQARARYGLHQNSPQDLSYREHLAKAVDPLKLVLKQGARGLDFGCGPNPTASVMLEEAGFKVRNYDPFFFPEQELLEIEYDFVICTEVAEHFVNPRKEFSLVHNLMRSGGWLALMTKLHRPQQVLADWWYAKDPTHVAFYSKNSLSWIAEAWNWEIVSSTESVHLLKKR